MTLFLYYSRSKILTRRIRCPPKVFIALMYDAIRTCDPVPQIFKQSILPCHITLFIFKFFFVLLLLMLRKEGKKAQFGTLIFPPSPSLLYLYRTSNKAFEYTSPLRLPKIQPKKMQQTGFQTGNSFSYIALL